MCGIAGVVRRDGAPLGDAAALADRLSGALAHRGPDGCGAWQSPAGDALFVHRRLAIIAPTPEGAQPMVTPDGRHRIVFNGEVYNFRELRADLASRGERFGTSSDTEVLLRLLALDGPKALARVRGMFALACWDAHERSLLLARDRYGIKPLYVATSDGQVAFASELGALRAAGLLDGRPSPVGVLAFLAWGSVPPPLTWLRGAAMLPAGCWSQWQHGGLERRGAFADVREMYRTVEAPSPPERAWGDGVADAVRQSVRAHLVADVPVGVFLSGGIDSGAIVSAASSVGATNLETFTVDMNDSSSEAEAAAIVARSFGMRHHTLRVDAARIADDFPCVLAHMDQPTIDAVNTFYVARAVAGTGIKAVLSGTGGDELFGGYPSFRRLSPAVRARRLAGPLWPAMAAAGRTLLPARLQTPWASFADSSGAMADAYRAQRAFFHPTDLVTLIGPALAEPAVWTSAREQLLAAERELLDPLGDEAPAAAVARLETRLYLQSQLLRDTDVMSMAHGLEVRVPFVDHELAASVWPELARHPSLARGKRLLYSTLERPLPAAVVQRPKQGFTLPIARWMRDGALAPLVTDGLERLAAGGWITKSAPTRVWTDWQRGRLHWSRPWGLGVLGHLLEAA